MSARIAAVLLIGLACMAGSHWLMTLEPASPWNAVALIAPMLAAAALGTWRAQQRARSLLLLAGVAALVLQAATGTGLPAPVLYLSQHAVIHLLLALWFGSTLRSGAQPMIAMLAEKVHGHLTPTMAVYCRAVTRVWVAYFVGMAVVSVLLFVAAPFEMWAVFANLLTPLSLAALFIGERFVRYRLHPEFERASLLDAVRAYRNPPADRPSAVPPAGQPKDPVAALDAPPAEPAGSLR